MYRHFAAVTVMITAGLAIATSDDPRPAEIGPVRAATGSEARPPAKAYGEPTLRQRSAATGHSAAHGWGPEDNFQEPPETGLAFGDGFVTAPGAGIPPGELDEDALALLSPEERERLARQQAALGQPRVSAEERRAQARRIAEASQRRSGGSEF